MKSILTVIFVSILSNLLAQTDTDYCVKHKDLSFEGVKREIKIFRNLKEIRLVSYVGENRDEKNPDSWETIPKTESGVIDFSRMKENILTEGTIRDEFVEQFFNVGFDPKLKEIEFQTTMCWVSRVAVLFVDINDNVIGHYEICFSCRNAKKYPRDFPIENFCYGKYEIVKDIFVRAGIKYGLGDCGD